MASKRISELPAATALDGSEQIPLTQAGETRRLSSDAYEEALNLVHDVTHPDYGAVGDRSVDDTAAINSAISGVPDGGIVFFPTPSGAYRCDTNLAQITKAVTLMGGGGRTTTVASFGAADWDTDNENGAVLEAHATSGVFVESDATTFGRPINIVGLTLKGRGDATRTTLGVRLHNQAGQSYWRGVSILNFQTGLKMSGAQDCGFYGLITRGNQVGIETLDASNQNTWHQWDSSADTTGFLGTAGVLNAFYGGAVQNYDVAFHIVGEAESRFDSFYLESSTTSGTHAILFDGTSAPDENEFNNFHYGGTVDAVEVQNGNGNKFYLNKTKPGSITFASGTSRNRVEGNDVGAITDNGDNLVVDRTSDGVVFRHGAESSVDTYRLFSNTFLLPPDMATGYYYASAQSTAAGTIGAAAERITFHPFISEGTSLDRIAVKVTSAGTTGAVFRLGIYVPGGDGRPATLDLDAGTVDATTTGLKEITIAHTPPRGLVWLAVCEQGGASTRPQATRAPNDHPLRNWIPSTNGNPDNPSPGVRYDAVVSGAFPSSLTVSSIVNEPAVALAVVRAS